MGAAYDTLRYPGTPKRDLVHLSDDTCVEIRRLSASDKRAMRAALEKLSPISCYRRFMSCKTRFTEREVNWLTAVDGVHHYALCALREGSGPSSEIVGTARYIRLHDDEETAEFAVMVLDAYQHKGLGTALFQRLLRTASDQGLRWLQAELLADNTPMKHLIDDFTRHHTKYIAWEPCGLTTRIPVPRR